MGGLGRSSNPANSVPFTSAADVWSLLTASAGDDGKFIKYVHPGSYVLAAPSLESITGKFTVTGDISPSQITSNQSDYNPTGLSTASILRLSTDASRNISGLAGGEDGRLIVAFNIGSNDVVFTNQDAGSAAANRFLLTVNAAVKADECESFIYDSTTGRWRGWAMHFGVLQVARGGTNSATALNSDRMIVSSAGAIVESAILRPGTGTMGELRFYETPASGTNYVALKAATSLAADVAWTLPVADGTNGQALTTNGTGTLSWTTISGGTSPFTSTGGIIDYATATDRLRLKIGELGDIGLEVTGIASQTANFIDVKTLSTDTQPIFAVNSAGRIRFGPGVTTAVDTILYRSGPNTLTMDHVIISGTATAGGATALTISPGSHTAQTAEKNDFLVNAHTNTITGAITTQRFNWFRQPTITAASALTVTTAATLAIEGAPIAAGSATIGDALALWVQSGATKLDGSLDVNSSGNRIDGSAVTGGIYALTIVPGNHAGVANEVSTILIVGNTATISASYATQRFSLFRQNTINAASSLTVTTGATLAIEGAPIAAGSATITNAYAFWVQAGRIRVDGGILVGAEPTGISGTVGLTNTVDNTANSTGAGTIKFKGTTSRDSSGFLKILDGTTARYIPYFDAITG